MFWIAFFLTTGIQVSVSYCIDSYKDLSGEAMIIVILIRNTMSFASSYTLNKCTPTSRWMRWTT
jgi:hypothetical protein